MCCVFIIRIILLVLHWDNMVDELIPNFPAGPLDRYRKHATFDWRKLKIFLESEEIILFAKELYEELKKHHLLHTNHRTPTFNEFRHETAMKCFTVKSIPILDTYYDEEWKNLTIGTVLLNLDASITMKLSLSARLFAASLLLLGTEQHLPIVYDVLEDRISGCFCLTEIGHGSNSKGIRTTATYDANGKQFVLNTPDFEAAKCWSGNLGQTSTHAVIYAKLITADGVQHGLHAFIVPIRDRNSLLPFPGIIVGDMGEKAGLNGVDNGFVMLDNCRIPREYLLNRNADVNDAGDYVPVIKNRSEMHGTSLSILSNLRTKVVLMAYTFLTKAVTIAIRYAAVRKQFGPKENEELPIIEYQLHQHRLLPHLAAAYHLKLLAEKLDFAQMQITKDKIAGTPVHYNAVSELHALSCAAKPIAGWIARDGIQECREACGGHGYLKAAGISSLRDDNDANCTIDGENHVLIQQTSNWLLKFWPEILEGKQISAPLNSINFLTDGLQILSKKFKARNVDELIIPENIISMYQWLTCYFLKISHNKYEANINKGMDPFTAKNENQVFYSRSLGIAYIQHFSLNLMNLKIQEATDLPIKRILKKLLALYGLFSLEKHIPVLYQGGYACGENTVNLIQEATLQLCSEIKGDAISLIDVIAPPDILLNSVLGASDGQVYNRLQASFYQSPDCMTRPPWWKDIVDRSYVQPKL